MIPATLKTHETSFVNKAGTLNGITDNGINSLMQSVIRLRLINSNFKFLCTKTCS